MTWADVADTALKLGVPSLIAAVIAAGVAILLSRRSRAHEFERERRRRKQDCLERAIEDFDECDLAMDEYYVIMLMAAGYKDNPNLAVLVQTPENQVAAANKTDAAELKFRRSTSKLEVFGFKKSCEALKAYCTGCPWSGWHSTGCVSGRAAGMNLWLRRAPTGAPQLIGFGMQSRKRSISFDQGPGCAHFHHSDL